MNYEEINKRTWNGAKALFADMFEESSFWIFRGQSNPEWVLRTTIESELQYSDSVNTTIERELINEFKRSAHNYIIPNQMPESQIEWLALMQHHGAPTRLIDFTKSPYIATYFAFENLNRNYKYVSVWAVESYNLMKISTNILLELLAGTKNMKNIASIQMDGDESINAIIINNRAFVHPLEPNRMNERFKNQQGAFLISGNINQTLHSNLIEMGIKEDIGIIRKINIPVSERMKVLQDLYLMNITPATLFPGLDGFSRYIKSMPEFLEKKLYTDFIKRMEREGNLEK